MSTNVINCKPLGLVYTKRQCQRCDNSSMRLAILFSFKTMESLENRLQPHSGATLLISMRTELQASLLCCRSVDADVWCKWVLTPLDKFFRRCHLRGVESIWCSITLEFFLNVFTEFASFSKKNICHYSKRTRTCHLSALLPQCQQDTCERQDL